MVGDVMRGVMAGTRALRAALASAFLVAGVGLQAGGAAAGALAKSGPMPTAGCNFAAHAGKAGKAFKALPVRVQDAAITLCNAGILTGTASNLFSPAAAVTRAQEARALVKALNVSLAGSGSQTFTDVSTNSPYYTYIETAFTLGIMPYATAGGAFDPSQATERQEFAASAVDALGLQAQAAALAQQATPYSDDANLSPAYRGDVNEALSVGVLTPYTKSRLNPAGALTRAGFALGLVRIVDQLALAAPAAINLVAAPASVGIGTATVVTPTYMLSSGKTISLASLSSTFDVSWAEDGGQVVPNPDGTVSFVAANAGTYEVDAILTGGGLRSPVVGSLDITVYGPAVAISLSAPSSVVADGVATATVDVELDDANGAAVANSAAPLTLSGTDNGAVTQIPDQEATQDASSGLASFTELASVNPGRTDTLTVSSPGLPSATTTISTVAAVPTSLSATAQYTSLSANGVSPDVVSVTVLDQDGNPVPQGTIPVAFAVTGQGTFASGGTAQVTSTYQGGGTVAPTPAAATVYSETGVTGGITVTASLPTFTAVPPTTVAIQAVVVGAPAALEVSATTPGTSAGSGAGLTGTAAKVTVTVVDASGAPSPVSKSDAVALTFASALGDASGDPTVTAVGPDEVTTLAPGMSTITIPVPSSLAGTFDFTVADAAGLTSASGSVTFAAGPLHEMTATPDPNAAFAGYRSSPSFVSFWPSGDIWFPYVNSDGSPVNVRFQLADANGNPVAEPGVPVYVEFGAWGDWAVDAPLQGEATFSVQGQSQTVTAEGEVLPLSGLTDAQGGLDAQFQGGTCRTTYTGSRRPRRSRRRAPLTAAAATAPTWGEPSTTASTL